MDITKEKIMDAVRRAPPHGLKMHELAQKLGLDTKGSHRLRRLLEELQASGAVERAPGARYRVPAAEGADDAAPMGGPPPAGAEEARTGALEARTGAELASATKVPAKPGAVGRLRVHPAGYGFVERDDGEADVFVPARFRGAALDGDRVRLSTWMGYKGTEGRVEEVVSRGRAKLTGILKVGGKRQVYLEPDDPRIASTYGYVGLENGAGGAKDGDCVVAEITRYPTQPPGGPGGELWARVAHVLGDPDDPRTEVAKVIVCADIPDTFPDDALAAAKRTPTELCAADFADRIDLRDRPFLTIDPVTARDFDDAVCLEDRGRLGHRLWVAVADVSHYVVPGTALDREARIRGCSVYLPDRAIPMLPPELSSGICSLNPEVDRCAMVVRIDVDAHGVPGETAFSAAVIRSHARLDYPGVAAALSGDFRGPRARYQEWAADLERMNAVARKMRHKRLGRGSLDFDLPEAFVALDEDDPRRVRDVCRSKANEEVKVAYQLVEEFMLAANEAVARFFGQRELDCVWRVHDKPDEERLQKFADLAASFGIHVDPEEALSPKALQEVLVTLRGKPYERALNFLLLRSLKQATYDTVNIGHFGLASTDYLHFTSPIRRYPDLIVHRLLKFHLRKDGLASGGAAHAAPPSREILQAMAGESSAHERRAASAEREVVDMYRAFLMRDRIGEELTGIISAVTNFGAFVEVEEPFVEGLVKLDTLGEDRYMFDEEKMRLVGRRTGKALSLGDPVKVRVENVSVARRRIDLILLEGGHVVEAVADGGPHKRDRGGAKRKPKDTRSKQEGRRPERRRRR
jgi:ribonuclease R